jgi:hypothetical protein
MVIPFCPFEREYSGNTPCRPPSSGPTYEPTSLSTSLPTYISTYLHLHMEYCATQLDSTRNSTTYLPTSTYLHLHMECPRARSRFTRTFPVKVHIKPTGQERRNYREPLVFFQSGSLLLGSLQGPLRLTSSGSTDLRILQGKEVFEITLFCDPSRRPEDSSVHRLYFVRTT